MGLADVGKRLESSTVPTGKRPEFSLLLKPARELEAVMSWRLALCLAALGLWLAGCNYKMGKISYDRGDHERAVEVWESAASWGDVQAQMALARLYTRGEHVPLDLDRALHHAQ